MIPNTQSNNNGCTQSISSNCVIWQGPDIECINICNGATVSDVVAMLAEEIGCTVTQARSAIASQSAKSAAKSGGTATSANSIDLNSLVQKCLATDNGRNAESVEELLQWIIDKICPEETAGSAKSGNTADPCAFATTCTLPLPSCINYEVGGSPGPSGNIVGGTTVTEQVLYDPSTNSGWIITVGNYICGLWSSIQTMNSKLSDHETRIAKLEQTSNLGTKLGSGGNKTNAEKVVSKYLKSGVTTAGALALASEKEIFDMRQATGTAGSLRKAVSFQQPNLSAEKRLNGQSSMGDMVGFRRSPRTVADAIQNLWLTTNDMRAAVSSLQTTTAPAGCTDIKFDVIGTINYTSSKTFSHINLDFTGCEIPVGYSDCGSGNRTKITVSDAGLNQKVFYANIAGQYQHNKSFQIMSAAMGPVSKISNLVVKVEFCVSNDANQCGDTQQITISNTQPCPYLQSTATSENSITYSYTGVVLQEGTVTVNLLNSTGSIIQTNVFNSWASGVSGVFSDLTAGTTYQLQMVLTNTNVAGAPIETTCPAALFITKSPSCTLTEYMRSAFSVTTTSQGAGANSLDLATYYDGATIYHWEATFDSSGAPIVIESNPTSPIPTVTWKSAGDFISEDPQEAITCGDKLFTASTIKASWTGTNQSGWKYAGSLTAPSGEIYYVYALINTPVHHVVQVVFCCDCKQTTLVLDNEFGVYYCIDEKTCQIRVNVVGDVSQQTITPVWSIVSPSLYGSVTYDPASSTASQGVFNYTNNSSVAWSADSFQVKYKNSCGSTQPITVPILQAQKLSFQDEDICVFLDTTVYTQTEADGIKASFNSMGVSLGASCGWNGNLYYIPLKAGTVSNHKEPGDYIKHIRSLIDSQNGVASVSIEIETSGAWNTWKNLPSYWTASNGSWRSSVSIFSFVGQVNTNGTYGNATLATGLTGQTTTSGNTNVTNSYYNEDYAALLDMYTGAAGGSETSTWAVNMHALTGEDQWKAGSIPFIAKQFIISKASDQLGTSAAASLQILAASTGPDWIPSAPFAGNKTGSVQYPIDLSSYLLAGTATGTSPYAGNDGGLNGGNNIKALTNFRVMPNLYFENGLDWSTTNPAVKKQFMMMIGAVEGSPINCPSLTSAKIMGPDDTVMYAKTAVTGVPATDQAAGCLAANTPANCTHQIWNMSGDIFDKDIKAYYSQSGATNAQSEYELPAGYYTQCGCTPTSNCKTGEYVPAGPAGNYWRNITNCP